MPDVFYAGLSLIFFILAASFARGCEKLLREDQND